MPVGIFQTKHYVRKNERFPFDWTTCRGTARALANFRRQEFNEAEARIIDTEPGVYYAGRAEYTVEAPRKPEIVVMSQPDTERMKAYTKPWA